MGWPQITMIALFATSAGIHLARHGEPEKGKYNFWKTLLSIAINVWILWAGGFF